jgi:rod shape-determining protein MreC
MEFFSRYKNALVLITVLLAQTIALAVQVRRAPDPAHPDSKQVRLLRLWAAAVVTPFARTAHFVGGGVRGGWSNYVDLWHVRQQNHELRDQLAAMRMQQAEQVEDMMQGHRLQALMKFREQYVGGTVVAQVIATSGNDQSRMLLLDKGADAGLRPDMAVVTPDGVVGKIRDVFPHSSQLLLLNDQSSGAGVILESTRLRAILKGTATGRLQIGNLTADSRIQPGEKVLTSGGDQVFPRGLPVGTVESIAPDPEHQPYTAIRVKPAANLSQLEEVIVITDLQSELPAQAQQDLKEAEAKHLADAAAAAKAGQPAPPAAGAPAMERGLDLSGGQQEPLGAAAAAAAAGKVQAPPAENATGGLVPKPIPVLHPDRYSPGVTPPATDLTPGAPHGGASTPAATPATPASPPPPAQHPENQEAPR